MEMPRSPMFDLDTSSLLPRLDRIDSLIPRQRPQNHDDEEENVTLIHIPTTESRELRLIKITQAKNTSISTPNN